MTCINSGVILFGGIGEGIKYNDTWLLTDQGKKTK
jgi:hypothetical protein